MASSTNLLPLAITLERRWDKSVAIRGETFRLKEYIKAMAIPGFKPAKWDSDIQVWIFCTDEKQDALDDAELEAVLTEHSNVLNERVEERARSIKTRRQENIRKASKARKSYKEAVKLNEAGKEICEARWKALKQRIDVLLADLPKQGNEYYYINGSWLSSQHKDASKCLSCRHDKMLRFGDETVKGMSFDELFAKDTVLPLLTCPFCGHEPRRLLDFN
jgi:hypothetical protein